MHTRILSWTAPLLFFLPLAAAAQERDVVRERFVFLNDDLTIDVLAEAPGALHLLRGRPGLLAVSGKTRRGFAGFGLAGVGGSRLQLTAVGADRVDYLVIVPEDVWVRIRLPGHRLSEVFGSLKASATYHWGGEAAPAQPRGAGPRHSGSRTSRNHPEQEGIITQARTRINDQIRISPVRLIDAEGEQLGVVSLLQAKEAADQAGLDLVEVAPEARPPVVRLLDWGKYRYEQQKRDKVAKKRQHTVDIKEVKFRPKIEEHDFDFKIRNARRFLEQGKKVKVTLMYRGRELRRPELGVTVLDRVAAELEDIATVQSRDGKIEGRRLTMMLSP